MSESIRDTNNTQQQPERRAGAAPRNPNSTPAVRPPIGFTDDPNDWRTPAHNETRKTIIKEILRLILMRRPNPNESERERFARMAKKLEARLYFTAPSFEYHTNLSTLPRRISNLAIEIIDARRPTITNMNITEEDIRETEVVLNSVVVVEPPRTVTAEDPSDNVVIISLENNASPPLPSDFPTKQLKLQYDDILIDGTAPLDYFQKQLMIAFLSKNYGKVYSVHKIVGQSLDDPSVLSFTNKFFGKRKFPSYARQILDVARVVAVKKIYFSLVRRIDFSSVKTYSEFINLMKCMNVFAKELEACTFLECPLASDYTYNSTIIIFSRILENMKRILSQGRINMVGFEEYAFIIENFIHGRIIVNNTKHTLVSSYVTPQLAYYA